MFRAFLVMVLSGLDCWLIIQLQVRIALPDPIFVLLVVPTWLCWNYATLYLVARGLLWIVESPFTLGKRLRSTARGRAP